MDFDSSAKFVASLAKFLQSLCNGYVDFDKGVEVIGHIHINVDSDLGKKVDYVLNERVCKNDNSITFISNSFPAQPAEKPQPPPKKTQEPDKTDGEQDELGQMVPNSTNVGTIGSYRNASGRGHAGDNMYTPGSKRPGSPHQHRNLGSSGSPSLGRQSMSQSPRYQDSGGPSAKISRADVHSRSIGGESYEGDGTYQGGGDEEDYSSNYDDATEIDQKPVIDPDISIVKEEYMANQQGSSPYPSGNQTAGLGRGKGQPSSFPHQSAMNQGHSNYSGANMPHSSEMFTSSPLEGTGDPSTLTRAQQEELEMYYRKGTDQHLTFLRNMREAHAMYPFTGKRDKELFEKALAEVNSSLLAKGPEVSSMVVKLTMELKLTKAMVQVAILALRYILASKVRWACREECHQLAQRAISNKEMRVMTTSS